MITCYLRNAIDPYQLAAFERYSRLILPPVQWPAAPHRDDLRPAGRGLDLGASGPGAGSPATPAVPA